MSYSIGVDIGGTFADFCLFDEDTKELHTLKVLTSPDNPGEEIAGGINTLSKTYNISPTDVRKFIHGTTVGINTIIQRKGASLALITTAGFEDVIEIARLRAPDPYDLFSRKAEPLVPRDRVFGVTERVTSEGEVETPIDLESVEAAIAAAVKEGVGGIVVALLNSYRNDEHERAVCDLIEKHATGIFAFRSSEVWPVVREYERTTTTILNGYVHPIVKGYLGALQDTLKREAVSAEPMITKSNGGIMSCEAGKRNCVSMLLSGTASGVIGAAYVGNAAGEGNLLTLDIGGTSADVAVVLDGNPQFGMGEVIGEFPLYLPSVSVTSIGEGGGSIAHVDNFGVLKVGPESAGSTPGPACYGRGGKRPTITDAMLLCGFLGHQPLAYGALEMDQVKALSVMQPVAKALGWTIQETSETIIKVAVSGMYAEVNKLTARFGVDVRELTLMPFGGAGPMLGCFLARELGVHKVLIPRRPGTVSALGGLVADVKSDFVRTIFIDLAEESVSILKETLDSLSNQATNWLRQEQPDVGEPLLKVYADMVYKGQAFDIEVPLEVEWLKQGDIKRIAAAFHVQHEAIYAHADKEAPVRVVNIRVVALGVSSKPELPTFSDGEGKPEVFKQVDVFLDGGIQQIPVYRRNDLAPGHQFSTPSIIAQEDTTVCIPGGFNAVVDRHCNVILTVNE